MDKEKKRKSHLEGESERRRVIWKESQKAVRDEENEGKGKGKRWIKKRRKENKE